MSDQKAIDKKKADKTGKKPSDKPTDKKKVDKTGKKPSDKPTDKKKTPTGKAGKKGEKKEEKKVVVVPSKDFDLAKYASRYEGQTKYTRLRFIADRSPTLQAEAYKLAMEELKKGRNTTPFRQIAEKLSGVDTTWADVVDKQRAAEFDEYEAALNNAKQNQERTKQRAGHNKIGDFLYDGGDYQGALRSYMRAQQDSTTPETQLQLCFNVIRAAIPTRNWVHVQTFSEQVSSNPLYSNNPAAIAEVKAACGLAALHGRKFHEAARRFSEIGFDGISGLPKLISVEDIALYTGLTALAEFNRRELKSLIDDANFKSFTEALPVVQTILVSFSRSNYAECLSALESLKNDLQLDYYLHDHATTLYERIRNKALKEYFLPYESVDLQKMAVAFQTTVPELEKELAKLILSNQILARIDSFNKRLVARQVTTRTGAYDQTVETGENFQTNSRALLLRVNLTRNNFMVKPVARQGAVPMGMGGGMMGGGMMGVMMGQGGGRR